MWFPRRSLSSTRCSHSCSSIRRRTLRAVHVCFQCSIELNQSYETYYTHNLCTQKCTRWAHKHTSTTRAHDTIRTHTTQHAIRYLYNCLIFYTHACTRQLVTLHTMYCECERMPARYARYAHNSAVAFVVGKNQEHRPALTGGEEVRLYRGLKPFEEAEARKRQGTRTDLTSSPVGLQVKNQARDQAAKHAGIGSGTAARIDYVEAHASDLIPALETGEVSVNRAYTQARERSTIG